MLLIVRWSVGLIIRIEQNKTIGLCNINVSSFHQASSAFVDTRLPDEHGMGLQCNLIVVFSEKCLTYCILYCRENHHISYDEISC